MPGKHYFGQVLRRKTNYKKIVCDEKNLKPKRHGSSNMQIANIFIYLKDK